MPRGAPIEGGESPDTGASDRWKLRLVISVPVLVVLFIVTYGVISYELFSSRWAELEQAGAGEPAARLLKGHLYAMIFLVPLGILAGLVLAMTILRPIRALVETARKISLGRLDERAPTLPTIPELGDLSHSFNSMIDFINESVQERNRYLVEAVTTGLLTVNLQGKVTALNSIGAKILRVKRGEVVGRAVDELRAVGSSQHRPFWEHVENCLREDRTQTPDEILLNSDRGSCSLLVGASVLRDSSGLPQGAVLNFRDAAEIKSLNQQLSKTDRLAALGTFTMGLAHELRNPLASIKGMVQLIQLAESEGEEAQDILDRVVGEVDRLDSFVRELLDFSNQSISSPEPLDLNEVLHAAKEQAQAALEEESRGISICEDYVPLAPVIGESGRLIQAFSNLIRNAFEAASHGGRITLRTRRRLEGGRQFDQVQIHNTGSTIAKEDRSKIFDPFFSTKEKGSGLGLAIAYQIISQNGGTIDLSVGPDDVTFIMKFEAGPETADTKHRKESIHQPAIESMGVSRS